MSVVKGVVIILCVFLIMIFVACGHDNKNEIQEIPSSTIQEVPAITALETPKPPQQMESPIISDDKNVSLPDPG